MTINHHADDATLMSYAAGSLPEALSAVVAAHVRMCPCCRREVDALELLGGTLLAQLPPAMISQTGDFDPSADAATKERCPARAGGKRQAGKSASILSRLSDRDLANVQWRRLGPGIWHFPLQLSPGAKGDLRLFKVAPGQTMPQHGHGGTELTLILAGSYRDEIGRFELGDLAELDQEHDHSPVSDRETGCICLIASEEKARYKGLIARLLQPLIGI